MNWKIIPVATVIVFSIHGCGGFKTMEMSAVLSNEQQEGYKETIRSQKKHFVSLAPYGENILPSSDTAFILFVKNCGEDPIDISTQNISAKFYGNTSKWASRNIAVLSPDKSTNKLEMVQLSSQVAANLSTSTEYQRTYDLNGNYTGTRAFTVYEQPGYQHAKSSFFAASREIEIVEELALQPQTLQPGEDGGGLVVCDTSGMNSKIEGDFHLVVSVNDEQHNFTFKRSLKK